MRILSLLRWAVVSALLLLLVAPAAMTLFTGTRLVVVDGKSMTPTYEFGDFVLIGPATPDDFQPGHVVTVGRPNGAMYTHRIQDISDGKATLKGDGNTAADPDTVTYDQLVGAVRGHIGGPLAPVLAYAQTVPARISLAVLILALILLPLERRPASQTDDEGAEGETSGDEDTGPADPRDAAGDDRITESPHASFEDVLGLTPEDGKRADAAAPTEIGSPHGFLRGRSQRW